MPPKQKTPISSKIKADMFGTSADLPRIVEIDLANIKPNPEQPRKLFVESELLELAQSIEAKGLLQPILVQEKENGQYMIVAGERRFRAHHLLSRATIAAVITEGDAEEVAIIENLQRSDLRPLELAESLERLMQSHGYNQQDVAKIIGKARNTVTELLSLTKLPEHIKDECRTSDIASKSFLIELARMSESDQAKAWKALQQGGSTTVKMARQVRGHEGEEKEPQGKKAKQVFHTKFKASVIVQGEAEKLTKKQIISALTEALEAAGQR